MLLLCKGTKEEMECLDDFMDTEDDKQDDEKLAETTPHQSDLEATEVNSQVTSQGNKRKASSSCEHQDETMPLEPVEKVYITCYIVWMECKVPRTANFCFRKRSVLGKDKRPKP